MCGIAGVLVSPSDLATTDVAAIVKALALDMESRGHHATGIARLSAGNRIKVTKAPVTAKTFLKQHEGIGDGCRAVILHTRFATQGEPDVNHNNHPIPVGNIVGIHNGFVRNDYELYRLNLDWKRTGEVDSEAIFSAIFHMGAKEALETVEGQIAVAWMDSFQPGHLFLARSFQSPLWVGYTEGGSVAFSSEKWATEKALRAMPTPTKMCWPLMEGSLLDVYHDDDDVLRLDHTEFEPPIPWVKKTYTLSPVQGSTGAWGYDDWYGDEYDTSHGAMTAPANNLLSLPSGQTVSIDEQGNVAELVEAGKAGPFSERPGWERLTPLRARPFVTPQYKMTTARGSVVGVDEPLVFVPRDDAFQVIYGFYVRSSTVTGGMAMVKVVLDVGVTDTVLLPMDQLYTEDEYEGSAIETKLGTRAVSEEDDWWETGGANLKEAESV